MEDFEREGMIDLLRCRREEPTSYEAPETDQKWRSRNVISFHFRHFACKAPPAYRDVLLCAIDHANPTTGRCDVGQRRIAIECNLSWQTVNEAMGWWEQHTEFLRIENRAGRTNAYHINWENLERDWFWIQDRIASHVRYASGGVATYPTPGVGTYPTGGVASDPTLNIKRNLKAETQHEMAHPASPAAAYESSIENLLNEVTQHLSWPEERKKVFREEVVSSPTSQTNSALTENPKDRSCQ